MLLTEQDIGNIIDVIDGNIDDETIKSLLLLQMRTKYGVKNETAISICEKIFNDRYLANLIAEKLGNDSISIDRIECVIKEHESLVLNLLLCYPTYFSERIRAMCDE